MPANKDDSPSGGPDAMLFDPLTGEANFLLAAGSYAGPDPPANYFEPAWVAFHSTSPAFTCADPLSQAGCFVDFTGQARTSAFAGSLTVNPLTPPPQPVPEPGTLVLMATGLAGLVFRRHRS
jgi:hypothetical protein